jgi:hypothetical protein
MIIAEVGKAGIKVKPRGRLPGFPGFEETLDRGERISEIARGVVRDLLDVYDLSPGSELQQVLIEKWTP